VTGVEIEHTTLKLREGGNGSGSTSAVGLGTTEVLKADTVVFCIGDTVSSGLGLPVDRRGEYGKNPHPAFPVEGTSYEAYDEEHNQPLEGIFLAGWAREASSGLVGTARKDGEKGAEALLNYLETLPQETRSPSAIGRLEEALSTQVPPAVRNEDFLRLADAETAKAEELGIEYYKFNTNEEMLDAMGMLEMHINQK